MSSFKQPAGAARQLREMRFTKVSVVSRSILKRFTKLTFTHKGFSIRLLWRVAPHPPGSARNETLQKARLPGGLFVDHFCRFLLYHAFGGIKGGEGGSVLPFQKSCPLYKSGQRPVFSLNRGKKFCPDTGFYQVRQGCTWSRSYKSPSPPPPPPPPTRFRILVFLHPIFNFAIFLTTF
jgi:hypothetical protein